MSYFLKDGNTFTVTNEQNIDIRNELPVGTYSVMQSMKGYYLEQQPDIIIDHKVYGDAQKNCNRILNTFFDRRGSTGVILQGEKGSGKTMLAKLLSNDLRKNGIITLLINTPFSGEAFNTFLSSITQPALVIFDEFEKVYSPDHQNALLTLFDGTHAGQKLYVVALNDYSRLNGFMKNRPGRFYYSFTYEGLEESFVREYCEDNLNNKSLISSVVNFSSSFSKFNFDMLKAIVEEMNRYNESIGDVTKFLNIKPTDSNFSMVIEEIKSTTDLSKFKVPNTIIVNPMVGVSLCLDPKSENYEDDDYLDIEFKAEHLVRMNNGRFIFDNGRDSIVLAKNREKVRSTFSQIDWS